MITIHEHVVQNNILLCFQKSIKYSVDRHFSLIQLRQVFLKNTNDLMSWLAVYKGFLNLKVLHKFNVNKI